MKITILLVFYSLLRSLCINIKQINITNFITDNAKDEYIIDEKQNNKKQILILTNKKLYILSPFPFNTKKVIPFNQFISSSKYFLFNYKDNDYIIAISLETKSILSLSLLDIYTNKEITKYKINVEGIIFESIAETSLKFRDGLMLCWYNKHSISYYLFSLNETQFTLLTSNEFNVAGRQYNSDNYISIDTFEYTSRFIISYNNNDNNVIKIFSIDNQCLFTYNSLINVQSTTKVKILNENTFIICLRKTDNKNYCRITSIEHPEKHNQFAIYPRSELYDIQSINDFEFVLFNKRNDNDLFVQVYDLEGNKKNDLIHFPYQKGNYIKVDFITEYNLLIFLFSSNDKINIQYGIINSLCYNYEVNVDGCVELDFSYFARYGYLTKKNDIKVRLMSLVKEGTIKDIKNNEEVTLDTDYNLTGLQFCIHDNSIKQSIIQYKTIDVKEHEESSVCNIILNNINCNISLNNLNLDYRLHHENVHTYPSVLFRFFFLLTIPLIIIISLMNDYYNKKKYSSISVNEYYTKFFVKNNISAYRDFNQLFYFFLKRYNSFYGYLISYNPFYSSIETSLYLLIRLLLTLFFTLLSFNTSISSNDGMIIIFIKNVFIYSILLYFSLLVLFSFVNFLIRKNITITFNLTKRSVEAMRIYTVNEKDKKEHVKETDVEQKEKTLEDNNITKIASSIILLIGCFIYLLRQIDDEQINNHFSLISFILMVNVIINSVVIDYIQIYLNVIILSEYCYDINKRKTNNMKGVSIIYNLFIYPPLESEFQALEIFSPWFSTLK